MIVFNTLFFIDGGDEHQLGAVCTRQGLLYTETNEFVPQTADHLRADHLFQRVLSPETLGILVPELRLGGGPLPRFTSDRFILVVDESARMSAVKFHLSEPPVAETPRAFWRQLLHNDFDPDSLLSASAAVLLAGIKAYIDHYLPTKRTDAYRAPFVTGEVQYGLHPPLARVQGCAAKLCAAGVAAEEGETVFYAPSENVRSLNVEKWQGSVRGMGPSRDLPDAEIATRIARVDVQPVDGMEALLDGVLGDAWRQDLRAAMDADIRAQRRAQRRFHRLALRGVAVLILAVGIVFAISQMGFGSSPSVPQLSDARIWPDLPYTCDPPVLSGQDPRVEILSQVPWLQTDGRRVFGTPRREHVGTWVVTLGGVQAPEGGNRQTYRVEVLSPCPVFKPARVVVADVGEPFRFKPLSTAHPETRLLSDQPLPAWLRIEGTELIGSPWFTDIGQTTLSLRAVYPGEPEATRQFTLEMPTPRDEWFPITMEGAPTPRLPCAGGRGFVWTGTEYIVWGGDWNEPGIRGVRGDGARYNPATNTWRPMSSEGALRARGRHIMVWTGEVVILWGGIDPAYPEGYNDGAIYDPVADTWTPMSQEGAPSPRTPCYVWTGTELIISSGDLRGDVWSSFSDGARYELATDTWYPIADCPVGGRHATNFGPLGEELWMWSGKVPYADEYETTAARYNWQLDEWIMIETPWQPVPRHSEAVQTRGGRIYVWGGYGSPADGAYFEHAMMLWTPISPSPLSPRGSLSGMTAHQSDWWLIWGGLDLVSMGPAADGALFDFLSNRWVRVTSENAPTARFDHSIVWTGEAFLVWGGSAGRYKVSTNTGALYYPPLRSP